MRWCLLAVALLLGACDQLTPPERNETPQSSTPGLVGSAARGAELAQRVCAECHGLDGVLAQGGAPFIAGLKQEYLVKTMLDYRQGGRHHAVMMERAQALDSLQLADVTAYYSALETPWRGAVADRQSRAVLDDAAAREAAAHIVTGCKSCHSRASEQQQDQPIPSLDGMPLEYFLPALSAYAEGRRSNDTMQMFKDRLSEAERYRLGAYYAARRPQVQQAAAIGSPQRGRSLAQACAGCHGLDGNSLNPHMPNLAGQPAVYLRKAIADYRDGRRQSPLMAGVVDRLQDKDITDLAAYYTRQRAQSALHVNLDTMHQFDVEVDGRRAAAACESCHGETRPKGVPRLNGQSVEYLVHATLTYQRGERKHPAMGQIPAFYSDIQIEQAAFYYATRPVANETRPAVEIDAQALHACSNCHGEQGISADPTQTPNLAGQDPQYLLQALQAYARGERQHEGMQNAVAKLDLAQLETYADYFAALPAQAVKTFLPDAPQDIVDGRCSMCHLERGTVSTPGVPRLAGQLESYMIAALKDYRDHRRDHAGMTAMSDVLSLMEIQAVAAYYARQ